MKARDVGLAPLRCAEAEALLTGAPGGDAAFEDAAKACGGIEAMSDAHVTEAYRRHLAVVLTSRALRAAWSRAGQEP